MISIFVQDLLLWSEQLSNAQQSYDRTMTTRAIVDAMMTVTVDAVPDAEPGSVVSAYKKKSCGLMT